jgi:hypothetical protein
MGPVGLVGRGAGGAPAGHEGGAGWDGGRVRAGCGVGCGAVAGVDVRKGATWVAPFLGGCPAASYSPTPSPVQYHRRWWA